MKLVFGSGDESTCSVSVRGHAFAVKSMHNIKAAEDCRTPRPPGISRSLSSACQRRGVRQSSAALTSPQLFMMQSTDKLPCRLIWVVQNHQFIRVPHILFQFLQSAALGHDVGVL